MTPSDARKLHEEFLDNVYDLPHGDKIKTCIQCGTCSASCPSASAMQYGPREIIASLRAGMLDRVLNSATVWLCVSCYSCTVRCPSGIPYTDIMYELKRLEADCGLSRDAASATMARAFAETVDRNGRNVETQLLRKFYLRTNPLKALAQIPLAMKLFFRGRLELFSRKVKGLENLQQMMAAIDKDGAK